MVYGKDRRETQSSQQEALLTGIIREGFQRKGH
jgi:hypothetical protein